WFTGSGNGGGYREGEKKGEIFARVFSAVSQVGVSVELVSAGASEVAYFFLVKREYLRQVVAAIHREFFP
ncbi:MAG: hypothetical protein DRH10_10550, partial [Deltaproteobacteria bacterium]